ncbi:MAG: CRTAC1 family protein [Phycisphaeraceae bacterium]|nr:CRTAC1 family protein [Phycisphaeraceae bacterium]
MKTPVVVCAVVAWVPVASGQVLSFSDQTDAAGLTCEHGTPIYAVMASGGAAGDFNRDGWMDVYVVSGADFPDRLFINNGNGTFTDQASSWGVDLRHYGMGLAVGDYNNDGWLDVFINSGGPKTDPDLARPGEHILWRNNGDGTFTNVAAQVGLDTTSTNGFNGWGAAWGDYDLDGDLDLAAAGWINVHQPANCLFRNDGPAGFVNVTAGAMLAQGGGGYDINSPATRGFSPMFADMNGDRYPELLWVSDFGTSRYLINNGDGTFTEATVGSGVGLDGNGMGTFVGDIDNDLDFDWYVTSIFGPSSPSIPGTGNMLYVNNGDGTFVEQSESAGVKDGGWGWGTVGVDFNHDGWMDIAETNGWQSDPLYVGEQCYLWLNNGDTTFTENALALGFEHTDQGRGMLAFDADNDGDQEIMVFSSASHTKFFRNELAGAGARWLRVLLDTRAGRLAPDGYGSVVRIDIPSGAQIRQVNGGSHFLSQSELSAHFGLGDADAVDALTIIWANGRRTRLRALAPDQTLVVAYCPADMTGSSNPVDPDYGYGDQVIDADDFFYFLDRFAAGDAVEADLTGSSNPNDPGYGVPDGTIDADDFFYFLDLFVAGCP